ncbi:MAG: hypothetical protein ACFCVK_25830 [Acidimicrobiales bacterium]
MEHATSRNAETARDHDEAMSPPSYAPRTLEVISSDHDPFDALDERVVTGTDGASGNDPAVTVHDPRPAIAPPVHPGRRRPGPLDAPSPDAPQLDAPRPIAGWDIDVDDEPELDPAPEDETDPGEGTGDDSSATVAGDGAPGLRIGDGDNILQLRQIAGLTAGATMALRPGAYEFAEGDAPGAFRLEVDRHERAIVIPGAVMASIDTFPVTEPTPLGSGVLDVGSARFLIRHTRQRRRATEWLDHHHAIERISETIVVPSDLPEETPAEPDAGRRRRWRRPRDDHRLDAPGTLDVRSWEFVEQVRQSRTETAERERYHHPDPSELLIRARDRAPILGVRPPGHPLFAKVGVIVADMPWMPDFDDINAIPEWLGAHLRPLMSLPSIPIPADLTVGPLGIAGSRPAGRACARHVLLSLYGLSTADLTVHVATTDPDAWAWGDELLDPSPIRRTKGLPVVVVDGPASFDRAGIDHREVMDGAVGLVVLADSVEDLPSNCGTVLQVDVDGAGLLTNHLGHIIAGTPVGVDTGTAAILATALRALMVGRGR